MTGRPAPSSLPPDESAHAGAKRDPPERAPGPAQRTRTPQGQAMFILTVLGVIVALVIPIVAHFYRLQRP